MRITMHWSIHAFLYSSVRIYFKPSLNGEYSTWCSFRVAKTFTVNWWHWLTGSEEVKYKWVKSDIKRKEQKKVILIFFVPGVLNRFQKSTFQNQLKQFNILQWSRNWICIWSSDSCTCTIKTGEHIWKIFSFFRTQKCLWLGEIS